MRTGAPMRDGSGEATRPPRGERDASGADESSIEARDLVRDFGPVRAVDGVDLRVRAGEVLVLFGPNGAGKTSLLRLLGGDLRPTRGTVLFGGEPLRWGDAGWRRRVGMLSHRGFLYGHLTAEENLRFYGALYGLRDLSTRVPERLAEVGLSPVASRRVRGFSRGMRQRLAVARTLLHDPSIVLLDEPYTGLDPHAARLLGGILRTLRNGRRTVLLVTHHLREGLELADRVMVMAGGRVALDESGTVDPERFSERYRAVVGGEG